MKKLFLTYLDVTLNFFGVQRIVKKTKPVYLGNIKLGLDRFSEIIDKCEGRKPKEVSKWEKTKESILKFFGLEKFTGVNVITEKELIDPQLDRFNELLITCDRTYGPTGPKWDVDANTPMFVEPEVINEHNSDPNRDSKMDYKTLVDDEYRESTNKLKKQDPLYVNSVTRRKARAKIVGENTNTKARRERKSKSVLMPEDETFESLRKEILNNAVSENTYSEDTQPREVKLGNYTTDELISTLEKHIKRHF